MSIENILDQTKPRNKLLADILFKCELVEQFRSGVDLMFWNQSKDGKHLPDYNKSNSKNVILCLDGAIQDEDFARYFLAIADKKQKVLNDQELVALYRIKGGEKVPKNRTVDKLIHLGFIERVGRTRGVRYVLLQEYYRVIGRSGVHTRLVGTSRDQKKVLILKKSGKIRSVGRRRFAVWKLV